MGRRKKNLVEAEVNPVNLLSDHEMLVAIYSFINKINEGFDKAVPNAHIDKETLKILLGVSDSTLQRWRLSGALPYYIDKHGLSYYIYEEVFIGVKKGCLTCRGFDRASAIKRLRGYGQRVAYGQDVENLDEIDDKDLQFPTSYLQK